MPSPFRLHGSSTGRIRYEGSVTTLVVIHATPTRAPAPAVSHAPVADIVVAVAVSTVAVGIAVAAAGNDGSGLSRHAGSGGLSPFGIGLIVVSTMPLAWWRRAPFGIFALCATSAVVLAAGDYPIGFPFGAVVALYLLAASRDRTQWTSAMTLTVIGFLVAYLAATAWVSGDVRGLELSHTVLAVAVAWFAGERARLRRAQHADLHERAIRAERESESERRLAVAEERARIARDLHDAAGHAVNVIAVRAGAARLRHHLEPDRALDALEAIEELARRTAAEIDHIVGSLRDQDIGPVAPALTPPGMASLDQLVTTHRDAGVDVTMRAAGNFATITGTAMDRAGFRILQEALTNAARHGTGSVMVEVHCDDAGLDLNVTNPISTTASRHGTGGHGLVGMRERATLLGGTIDIGPIGAEFVVHAYIPSTERR